MQILHLNRIITYAGLYRFQVLVTQSNRMKMGKYEIVG